MPRLLSLVALCFGLLPGPATAQQKLVQPDLKKLDAFIAQAREEWNVPGLAVAIVKDGKVVHAGGYGVRELGKEEPVDADTLFAIASNTKAFTSASMAILNEEGKLNWNDRVQQHLPWLQLYDDYVSNEIRVEDLLCHRSGLGTFSGDLLWWGTPYSPEQVLRRAKHLKPAGSFRDHYGYSNLMFLAAGEVIAKASGQTWADFIKSRIFEPVGMQRSVTSTKQLAAMENVATPHKPKPDSVSPIAWYNWDTMAAAGGIISSVNDMSKWLLVQLNEGAIGKDKRLFSAESSWKMWSPQTIIPISKASRERNPHTHFRAYGLGWSLSDFRGHKVVAHGGGYDGMYSRVVMLPDDKLGIVVLTNSMTGISSAISNTIIDAYLGKPTKDWSADGLKRDVANRKQFYERIQTAITPKAVGTKPSRDLKAYVGTFGGPMYGDATVSLEDGKLVLRILPNKDLVADLTHLHFDTFAINWRTESAWFGSGTAHFVMDSEGAFTEIKLDVPNDDLWFYELELKRKDQK
jgi:CubicO group peptidase (beta-lactamase class C family)